MVKQQNFGDITAKKGRFGAFLAMKSIFVDTHNKLIFFALPHNACTHTHSSETIIDKNK